MHKYIGITDFSNIQEVHQMVQVFEIAFKNKLPRKLMVGVMMSYKTLNHLPTKWEKIWPKNEKLGELFISHPLVLNTLHYADFQHQTTQDDLVRAICFADSFGGLDALQLDMPWPEKSIISKTVDFFENTKNQYLPIILQVGTQAMKSYDFNRSHIISKIGSYQGSVQCILLDLSGGNGIEIDTKFILPYISEIRDRYPYLSIAIAGGLGPTTIRLIENVVEKFPDISIDAQGNLRVSRNAMDPVNWNMAKVYLEEAAKIFQ